jgi:inner membrane protein
MAAAAAPRGQLRAAAACGAAAGMLADADALIRSPDDALLVLEYHRHFTHALVFVPLGALLASVLLWPVMHRRLPWPRLYLYALLGYALSGVLDACTSYGTALLWPFSEERIAWSIVAIVDPVFSLLLAIPLLLALRRRRAAPARAGLALAALYLALGAVQHERAREALIELAAARGHTPQRLLVKPTLGNLVLWRGLYQHQQQVYADALRVGVTARSYAGGNAPLAPQAAAVGSGPAARFAAFADGWLVADPRHPGRLGDARYAMLPTSLHPLWGIETRRGGEVVLLTDRRMSSAERSRFADMLLGRRLGP